MDEKFQGTCPKCCQHFVLKSLSPEGNVNVPLFLKCGHYMCEICIRKMLRAEEPMECQICQRVMDLNTTDMAQLLQDKIKFYNIFPVNVHIIGELALELITEKAAKPETSEEDYFINVHAILASSDKSQGQCLECQSVTTKMCQNCNTIICQECFDKSHKSFVVFKTHILKEIEMQVTPNNCLIHLGKSLDYYCKDCRKLVCLDCLMIGSEKSCKSHNVVPITEMNEEFFEDLQEVMPQVDTIFRRLTKTAVDIGYELQKIEKDKAPSDLKEVTETIEQHFSKLSAEILTHKKEVLGIIAKLNNIEKDLLVKAKHDVAKAMKDAKKVLSSLKSAMDYQIKPTNVSTLLNDAKNILTTPWHLIRDESNKDPLKVTVNDDLCLLMSDYIQLEGNAKALYKLRASHELGGYVPHPPLAPVFPPLLTKDTKNNNAEIPNKKPAADTNEISNCVSEDIHNGSNESLQTLYSGNDTVEIADEILPAADEISQYASEIIANGANAANEITQRASEIIANGANAANEITLRLPEIIVNAANEDLATLDASNNYVDAVDGKPPAINGTSVCEPKICTTVVNGNTQMLVNEKPSAANGTTQCETDVIINCANDKRPMLASESTKPVVEPICKLPPHNFAGPLRAGNKVLVVISHMVDLDEFYVQLCIEQFVIQRLTEELEGNLIHLNNEKISIDGMYVVKHNEIWMRCQVCDIDDSNKNDPTYYVTCLDFGNTLLVKRNRLRKVPSMLEVGSSVSCYRTPCAVKCHLANCKPKHGVWNKRDVNFVLKIIDNKPVTIYIRHIGADVECDVTTHDGTSIAHALAFHSRGVLLEPNLLHPEGGLTEKPKLNLNNNTLKWESHTEVYIVYVESPKRFFVRDKTAQNEFNRLCCNLNESYILSDTDGSVYLPEPGLVCVVHVSNDITKEIGIDDIGWARAIVKSVGEKVVNVFLLDVGCSLEVEWHQLRRIKQKFTTTSRLSCECHLAGPRTEWSKDATDLLNAYKGHLLNLKVDKKHERKTVGAILFLETEHEIICINDKVAAYDTAESNVIPTLRLRTISEKSVETKSEVKPSLSTSSAKITSPEQPAMAKSDQKYTNSLLRLEAKILHYESPALIYVTLIPQQKTFNELFENIQKFYSKRKSTRRGNWKINDRCCALCIQSVTWRRATIMDVKQDLATVFYTDFACTETIPILNLKKLHSDFEKIGNAAIKCHLAGVRPTEGQDWPPRTIEFLKEKLDSYKRIFITRVGPFEDKSMPIELWVYHTDQGSALEPDISEWRCLNRAIINNNLGVADKNFQGGDENYEDGTFHNLHGSGGEWLQSQPMRVVQSPGASSSSSTLVAGDNVAMENTLFISDWLPADPLQSTEFTGTPTYIDNDGIIYLHDISQEDMMEVIRDSLEIGYQTEDPKAQYYDWRVGEPCVARYYLDNKFYRGTVIKVDKEQLQCTIQYIDYGNYEECPFSDLRKDIAMHQIPIQAHACSLSRIKPIGGTWDLPSLDYIHKTIVEKKCFVKVTGEPVDGIVPIDLKYEKLWINDHLVDCNLATYTDGSKPLVRQFVPIKGKVVKAERVLKVNTASEPDYIIDEEIGSSEASGSVDSFKMRTLTNPRSETFEPKETNSNFQSYPEHKEIEFECSSITMFNTNNLQLLVDDGENTYVKLYKTIQKEGQNMPPLSGIFENKACVALFSEDNYWYRAMILRYSEARNLVEVRYVDYGNIEIVDLQNVREIHEDWVKLPPVAISVRLHDVKANPEFEDAVVMTRLTDAFKRPVYAKIVHYQSSLPCVELRNNKQELIYREMLDDKIFLNDKCNYTT